MTRLTLQSRITAFMIVITVFLVAVFTFIQINNQLRTITQQNIFRAKLGAMLAKNALENSVVGITGVQEQQKALLESLNNLKQAGILQSADIIGPSFKIISSTNKYSRNMQIPSREQYALKSMFKSTGQKNQQQSQIDKETKAIFQYIPIGAGKTAYIVKLSYSLGNINDALNQVYLPCIFIAILIALANILLSALLSKTIIGPLKVLDAASKEIAGGKLELRIDLPTGDEIEEVANTFNDMTVALIRMKERAENANPLTKLPGNNVIHEEIEKRLNDKRKFVVVYSDLDNFKAFNDKYGIGAGDVAIKLTAAIMHESLKAGSPDDFIGHEGGDDFVLLTVPEKAKAVTEYITSEFDKRIRALYTKEDLERGFIAAKSREGELKQFPIMTLSLAGVSNIERPLTSYGEITNICASVKKVAKKTPGSVFVLDKMPEGH